MTRFLTSKFAMSAMKFLAKEWGGLCVHPSDTGISNMQWTRDNLSFICDDTHPRGSDGRMLPSAKSRPPGGQSEVHFFEDRKRDTIVLLARFGSDLLSHILRCSTIGATALNGRVRDGIGCFARAMTTKPRKKHNNQRSKSAVRSEKSGFCWIKSSLSSN